MSAPWRNLLSVLQDLARQSDENGDRCYFNLTTANDLVDFRIVRAALGSDLSGKIVFGVDQGNVSSMAVTDDYGREVNTVYVGGEGQGEDQLVAVRQSANISSYPIYRWEEFVQAGYYVGSDNTLEQEGDRYLAANGARRTIKAKAIDGAPNVYGKDFNHGDKVTLSVSGASYTCVIYAVAVTVDKSLENVELYLEAEIAL